MTAERPTRLSPAQVHAALRRLPDWTGNEAGISRTVKLPDDRITPLIDRVPREARRLNDHAHVERGPGTVTFLLRTGPASVSEPDFVLAERIDAAIADTGSPEADGSEPARLGGSTVTSGVRLVEYGRIP